MLDMPGDGALETQLPHQGEVDELEKRSHLCDFCRFRWNRCKQQQSKEGIVLFSRVDSKLRLNERHPPILSLHTLPGMSSTMMKVLDPSSYFIAILTKHFDSPKGAIASTCRAIASIQTGLPHLHESGSDTHVAILRHWLSDCESMPNATHWGTRDVCLHDSSTSGNRTPLVQLSS